MNTSRPVEDALEETAPLLVHDHESAQVKKATPLPMGQMSILMLLALAEPITSYCISPFLNQLISELDITGGDEKKVGYYAGMMQSIFFAMEALFVFQWARLSDHIGRKPVLLVGVGGLCISMICFGLSKTFWGLVISRSIVGMLNGNTGVTKCMIGEITDETNVAQGFAWLPVAWSVGSTTGPLIGGQLAKPHERWPSVFTHPFWVKYPYFLPCATSAAFSSFTFVVTAIFLKERRRPDPSSSSEELHEVHGNDEGEDDAPPPLKQLLTRRVVVSISNYAAIALVEIAFLALQPIYLATPIELGGLGLSPPTIGTILATCGMLSGAFQGLFFARLMARWGPKYLVQQGLLAFVPLYTLNVVMSLYAKAYGVTPLVWTLILLQQILLVIMDLAFGAVFIYIRSSSVSNRTLGATNGIAQFIASVMRTVGPAASTSLFAASLEHNWLGGYGVYPILLAMTVSLFFVTRLLPRDLWPKEEDAHRDD
ncbi:MFS general substrate transporter [Trametes maxima]|nr:MFS general substrate transporter [Trametes maxima]